MYRELFHELEVIASDELAVVLECWYKTGAPWAAPAEEVDRLVRYLRSELDGYGMLSVAKARDCGSPLGTERRQARALLGRLAA